MIDNTNKTCIQQNKRTTWTRRENWALIFVWLSPLLDSCGDYASGTNHTLPTYGYARMYSGVNTATFQKQITSQELSPQGLHNIGSAVATLATVEGLDAHKNAVIVRQKHLAQKQTWTGPGLGKWFSSFLQMIC